ncbi:SubName: Full=Uncharacterized protein {ECO:0000313/EMBL:CCA77878.1} [Serendipita indica DSM 11827]|nr:SubName: Full=Uncharacterized protein {ECO:0000313/EMBL:CCA77878.1} [Serendipita indica DSM 11827]
MVSAGALVWISCRPLLKMLLCTTSGFILARLDLFSAMAARGAGQVMLNITMPCLLFSKMVPAFTPDNISALGPLITIGCIYQILGLFLSLLVREFFWVPHRFRTGLLVAGAWSNWGDVPTAVIMSITASAPFAPGDVNLGVAYISAFILVFFITLFPLGGHLLIAQDFKGPDKEDEEVKEALRARQRSRILLFQQCLRFVFRPVFRRGTSSSAHSVEENVHQATSLKEDEGMVTKDKPLEKDVRATTTITEVSSESGTFRPRHHRHVSFGSHAEPSHHHRRDSSLPRLDEEGLVEVDEKGKGLVSPGTSTYGGNDMSMLSPTVTMIMTEKHADGVLGSSHEKPNADDTKSSTSSSSGKPGFVSLVVSFLHSLLTPATITMALAFPIALVKPLKALFVEMEDSPIPYAPDGKPPLYFILDTTNFLGAASVPLGLVCLGAALAKLKIPKTINALPVGAIASMAVGKLIVSPVLGVLIVNGFVKVGFIKEEDKVLRFVTMFFSCMPTATTQVFMTQVYSGTGEAEALSPFLIPQYALMFVSTTALTAYSLHTLF